MTNYLLGPRVSAISLVLATCLAPGVVCAADLGISGLKLIIVDKTASGGGAKVVFVSKDAGIVKGAEGDPAEVDANLSVFYTDRPDVNGGFLMPSGASWLVNTDTVAKYVNKLAPMGGGGVKVTVLKPGKLAKVVAKSLGDAGHTIDLVAAGAPSDAFGVTALLTVNNDNDASTTTMCARFSVADGSTVAFKEIAADTGRKLVAKNGVPCSVAPVCDPLNGAECLLPYPSSNFLRPDPTTVSGYRLNLPAAGIPSVNGPFVAMSEFDRLDGFSPTDQIMMHFPQGIDVALTDASHLLAPACCGQPAGPPWIDTRTYTGRSLDSDSPSVLIDADTNERILHFLEVDARATGGDVPGRQALFLRPGKSLIPGHRYIVAMRDLKTPANDDVVAEAGFAALRDGTPSGDPLIEIRRAYFDNSIFPVLTANGITRSELVLAFDFRVQTDSQLTRQIVSMRDQAYAWLDTVDATPATIPFTVTSVVENDCDVPGTILWRKVSGTYQSPLFLDAVPDQATVQFLNVDPDTDLPVQNGFMDAPFDVSIPCSVFDTLITSHPMLIGHGLFGTGQEAVQAQIDVKSPWGQWTYIAGGTDWLGLSSRRDPTASDEGWIGANILGVGTSKLNNFPAFTDRLKQGMLNTLVLSRLMKLGIFNRDAAFQTAPDVGVFPGPSVEMFYSGSSLGGIHGTWYAGLSPDVERLNVDVPAIAFSCLLQRSVDFLLFDTVIQFIGIDDPMEYGLFLNLLHEIWVASEPAGVATHVTSNPLAGSSAKKLLMSVAWLDKQVSNQCTEVAARTMALPNLEGSLQQGLQQIPDVTGPVDSAYIMYSSGAFDLFDPDHQPHIPPLSNSFPDAVCDPHGSPRRTPAHVYQFYGFLQPGGQVENFCNGTCDATEPLEIPNGGTCDGSNGGLSGNKCTSDAECGGAVCVATVCDPAP